MNTKETLQVLLEGKTPKVFGAILRKYPELKERLVSETSYLDKETTLAHRIYHLFNDVDHVPLCFNCKSKGARFISYNQGYASYCGVDCANSCETKKETTQAVWLEKYGSKEARAAFLSESSHGKTNFSDVKFQSEMGSRSQTRQARKKREETCLERYGVKSTPEAEVVKQRMKASIEERYENGHQMRDPAVIASREETFFLKYGVKNPKQNKAVVDKGIETCLKKYGVPNPAQAHIRHIDLWNDDNYIRTHFLNEDNTIKYREMMSFFGCNHTSSIRNRLERLGVKYKPYTGYSQFEGDIIDFLKEKVPGIIIQERMRSVTPPYEIDIYLPEYNQGIEFHGLTWHSFGYQPANAYMEHDDKNKHKKKADAADDKGVNLLQIFENEWHNPVLQNIWKSVILSKLNKTTRLYARKCTVSVVEDTALIDKFLISNHIQQKVVGATVCVALFYKGRMVSVMTFGKSRFADTEYELLRFCNRKYTTIVGGFSRLLAYFKNMNPQAVVVSYANRRWSSKTNNVYDSNGFMLDSIVEPGYYYYHQADTTQLWHRMNFQKHKLEGKLKIYAPELTETENMYANGYRKVYDAGQLKYILR